MKKRNDTYLKLAVLLTKIRKEKNAQKAAKKINTGGAIQQLGLNGSTPLYLGVNTPCQNSHFFLKGYNNTFTENKNRKVFF